jgi:hypothetical protein
MATNITRQYSLDNFFQTAVDPNNNTILDPYTFFWTDLPYFLRNSIGQVRRIDASKEGVPDLISFQEYGTHDLWWVLSIANQMITPDTEIEIGTNIYIPGTDDVSNFLSKINQRSSSLRIINLTPQGVGTNPVPVSNVVNVVTPTTPTPTRTPRSVPPKPPTPVIPPPVSPPISMPPPTPTPPTPPPPTTPPTTPTPVPDESIFTLGSSILGGPDVLG